MYTNMYTYLVWIFKKITSNALFKRIADIFGIHIGMDIGIHIQE